LVSAAALYARSVITTVRSTEAWFNAEITALRAPIAGEVRIEGVVLGQPMRKGQTLFTIENSRFGNEQVMSQMNWISDLADRLKAESQEAEIRYEKQAEITRLHEKMFADQVLPRLDLLEQQNTLALYGAVMTNKFVLEKKAAGRVEELSRQVELQRSATIQMPFDGAAWSMPAREGGQVAAHEKVIEVIDARRVWVDAFFHERHGAKLSVGREVQVQTEEGKLLGRGIIESIRGGVGRIPLEGALAVLPNEFRRNRVAVHVRLESEAPFNAGQFFGVGRSVIVTLGTHE
jgi:multidrug resistance efflux pump